MVVSEEKTALEKVLNDTYSSLKRLDSFVKEDARKNGEEKEHAFFAATKLKEEMTVLRKSVDEAELLVSKENWPVPTYGDLLFHS